MTLRAAVQQGQRQRAEAGPDLEDVVVAVDSGRRNDAAHGVCVVNEVLAEGLTRPKVELFGQMPYLGSTQQSNGQRRPHSPATHGPRTPTLTGPSDLSNRDLLFTCCQICPRSIPQTTVSFPGVLIKLHAAVKTVAGIDGPVAARFTSGERVPGAAITHRGHFRTRLGAHPQHPVRAGAIMTLATGSLPVSTPLTLAMANVTS